MKLNKTHLSLGSNMGNRVEILQIARQKIQEKIGAICSESSIYETAAWGITEQNAFLNQVIEVETSFLPKDLIKIILEIEETMGRKRETKWGPRLIDIDILYYEDVVVKMKKLIIPHPFLQERRFVLIPLVEISPNFINPKLKKTNAELLKECTDESLVLKKNSSF